MKKSSLHQSSTAPKDSEEAPRPEAAPPEAATKSGFGLLRKHTGSYDTENDQSTSTEGPHEREGKLNSKKTSLAVQK